jgi:hypothetical protein
MGGINKKQIEIYKKMEGVERLRIGFELFEIARKLAIANIRNQYPNIKEEEINEKLKERLLLCYKKKLLGGNL